VFDRVICTACCLIWLTTVHVLLLSSAVAHLLRRLMTYQLQLCKTKANESSDINNSQYWTCCCCCPLLQGLGEHGT
jgi:hypothetical protein